MLGTEDSLIRPQDSKDVLALKDAHELSVPGADHFDIYQLGDTDTETRYAIMQQAFCGEFADRQPASVPDKDIRRVVFILHGIRASNIDAWIKGIERSILAHDPHHTIVKHPTYGYLSAMRFVLPSVRRKYIATFQDWYTETLAEYPTAQYSIIAHSNGTYILGHSLLATPEIRFTNVALAGSVLPQGFLDRFDRIRLQRQAQRIRNHRANRDWPVALLCSALRGLRMRDIGTAGFSGDSAREVAYYVGGHGQALTPDHHSSLIDFVFGNTVQDPDSLERDPGFFRQLSNFAPHAGRVAVIAFILLAAFFIFSFDGFANPWAKASMVVGGTMAAYVFLDVI